MKQERDWTEIMRDALRDAEATPPVGGWERLERELGAEAPRGEVRRLPVMRVAAAAAAILVCVAVGSYLWRVNPEASFEGNVIATSADGGKATLPIINESQQTAPLLAQVSAPETDVAPRSTPRKAEPRSVRVESSLADTPRAGGVDAVAAPEATVAGASGDGETPTANRQEPAAQNAERQTTARAAGTQTRVQQPVREEKFVAYRAPHKRSSMALYAGGGVTGGRSQGNPGASVRRLFADIPVRGGLNAIQTMFAYDYEQSTFRHYQPFSFGLSVRKELGHGLSLESGVNYTLLLSSVTLPYATEDYTQKLHFIGVPLRLNWNFLQRRNFNLYIGAGGMVEKCVSAKFGSTTVDEPRVQWSVAGAVGAEYRLGGRTGLYFEPEASYYFTQTELRTARTDSPLTLTLRLGLRFTF